MAGICAEKAAEVQAGMSAEITIPAIQSHWRTKGFHAPDTFPEGEWSWDWVWTEEGDGIAGAAEHGIFAIETEYTSKFFIKPTAPSITEGERHARELRRRAIWSLQDTFSSGSFDGTFDGAVDGITEEITFSKVEIIDVGDMKWFSFTITVTVMESQ